MPVVFVTKTPKYYDKKGNLVDAIWRVRTVPIANQKEETDKYYMGDYKTIYSIRKVDKNNIEKLPIVQQIINIGKSNGGNDPNLFKQYFETNLFDGTNQEIYRMVLSPQVYDDQVVTLLQQIEQIGRGGNRRPSRKYKKSTKRVFRKKSRSTRRR